jgi:hypothetical protein
MYRSASVPQPLQLALGREMPLTHVLLAACAALWGSAGAAGPPPKHGQCKLSLCILCSAHTFAH